MHDDLFTLIVAPMLGWLAVTSLLIVAYLTCLELTERRRQRRLEEKRAQMESASPYRPKATRRLAFQTTVSPSTDTVYCPKSRQAFLKVDRSAGWSRTATNLN